MLQRIEDLANFSVAKGCGFAAIAILTFVVGLSFNMELAFRSGGFLCLMACMTLLLKAWHADKHPYNKTELWLLLEPADRPQAAIAQQIISNALREAYLRFGLHAAWLAAAQLTASLIWEAFLLSRHALH